MIGSLVLGDLDRLPFDASQAVPRHCSIGLSGGAHPCDGEPFARELPVPAADDARERTPCIGDEPPARVLLVRKVLGVLRDIVGEAEHATAVVARWSCALRYCIHRG